MIMLGNWFILFLPGVTVLSCFWNTPMGISDTHTCCGLLAHIAAGAFIGFLCCCRMLAISLQLPWNVGKYTAEELSFF